MANRKNITTVFAAFFIFCGFLFTAYPLAFAGREGMDEHHNHTGGMQSGHATTEEEIIVEHKTEPASITAGKPTTILFSLTDKEGKPVKGLSVHHDRILHVVIVAQDFSVFAHIHPEDFGRITTAMKKTAKFSVKYTFPKAGRYLIGVDFAKGDQLFSKHFLVNAAGGAGMGFTRADLSRKKRFGDLHVGLAFEPESITAGKEVTLRYVFKSNGEPVTDLEPYLSAPMHLSIISADLDHFIHTHGELPGKPSMEQHEHHMHMAVPQKFGPKIEAHVVFPAKGLYQIFGQVRHKGEIILTSFMVEVE